MTKARSNAVANAAKGDLTVGSGTNLSGVLGVGSNGDTIVADSSTSTGLRYQGSMAAGKNIVINGNMDIWQRGTSSASQGYQTADRWYMLQQAGTTTVSRETSIIPDGSTYSMKVSQATATSFMTLNQCIETLNAEQFAGQTVTASFLAAASASTAVDIRLYYSTTVDTGIFGSWTQITPSSGSTGTVSTTTFSKITGVFAVPSTAKSLLYVLTGTINAGVSVYFAQAQLEIGSVATQFTRAGGTIQGELAACQRYYYRTNSGANAFGVVAVSGLVTSTTNFAGNIALPVPMRTIPTSITISTLLADFGASQATITAATLGDKTTTTVAVANFTSSGMTVNQFGTVRGNNSTAAFAAVDAEL